MREIIIILAILALLLIRPDEAGAEPRKLSRPLKAGDLASKEVQNLSMSGAHSYITTKVDYLGLPVLFYRHFSDWAPRGPLFDPILRVETLGEDGQAVKSAATDYTWRPDRAQLACKYGDLVVGEQTIGYGGEDTLVGTVRLRSLAAEPVTVRLSGRVSEKLDSTEIKVDPKLKALRLSLSREVPNAWGYPPSQLDKEYLIAVDLSQAEYTVDDRSYSVTFDIPAGETIEFHVALTPADAGDEVRDLLANVGKALDATTDQVDGWLAEVKQPQFEDEHAVKMYYNAWYQFWYNTQHPEGLWSRPIITPSKSSYARGVWLWDSGFHIFGLLQGGEKSVRLAKDQIVVLCEGAKMVGHLPREVWVGAPSIELQAPGILTWAATEIYKIDKDKEFLAEIYDSLARNNEWFYENKDSNKNGLCEWRGCDSGWDTSPRWDQGETDAVDLNCWLHLDQVKLSEICRILGRNDEAVKWRNKSEETKTLIREKLWDKQDGCYYDLHPQTGEMIRVKTPAMFWTMFSGVATLEQAESMIKILKDPDVLWTNYPMPCVGKNEPTFEANNYWRGPVWINLNWITIQGLEKYGFHSLARELRSKSIEVIAKNPVPHEYYNTDTGKGIGASNYMWTGSLFIVMCNEQAKPAGVE